MCGFASPCLNKLVKEVYRCDRCGKVDQRMTECVDCGRTTTERPGCNC